MSKLFFLLFIFFSLLFANNSTQQGKELFLKYCTECHIEYIEIDRIKKNFLETNNTLLDLKAPTVNMMNWAITKGAKKIGEEGDDEFRMGEIADFLEEYLTKPNREKSICEPMVMKFYDRKKPLEKKLSKKEFEALASYLLYYKAPQKKEKKILKKSSINEEEIIQKAQKEHKLILVEVSANDCIYCKKMKKEVLEDPYVKKLLEENFIFLELNRNSQKLPFEIEKAYANITPSFFVLKANGEALDMLVGYINKKRFKQKLYSYIKVK